MVGKNMPNRPRNLHLVHSKIVLSLWSLRHDSPLLKQRSRTPDPHIRSAHTALQGGKQAWISFKADSFSTSGSVLISELGAGNHLFHSKRTEGIPGKSRWAPARWTDSEREAVTVKHDPGLP